MICAMLIHKDKVYLYQENTFLTASGRSVGSRRRQRTESEIVLQECEKIPCGPSVGDLFYMKVSDDNIYST